MASRGGGLNPNASSWEPGQPPTHTANGRGRGGTGGGGRGTATRGAGRGASRGAGRPPRGSSTAERSQEHGDPSRNDRPQRPGEGRGGGRGFEGGYGRVRGRGRGRGRGSALPYYQQRFSAQITALSTAVAGQSTIGPASELGGREATAPSGRRAELASQMVMPPNATELARRIYREIDSGNYSCPICFDPVERAAAIWSCSVCYNVLHLDCFKEWATKSRKRDSTQPPSSDSAIAIRCPACNTAHSQFTARKHYCWCGKSKNFIPAPSALPPNSCGRLCGRARPDCKHLCTEMCHAGPCPPCQAQIPQGSHCFCGKEMAEGVCRGRAPDESWSCGKPCDALLPCGVHRCQRTCHSDRCGDCSVPVTGVCFCGKVQKTLPCRKLASYKNGTDRKDGSNKGTFSCEGVCGQPYDCGVHTCPETCHAPHTTMVHCPMSPDQIKNCPCGKTRLADLAPAVPLRTSCQDPVPCCAKVCGRPLPSCGKPCTQVCHKGPCPPCEDVVRLRCQCHQTKVDVVCGDEMADEKRRCDRKCGMQLGCRRHACATVCCPARPEAMRRLAGAPKRRARFSNPTEIEEEHAVCTRVCDKPLRCGKHRCEALCHPGDCPSCTVYVRAAAADDAEREALILRCHCGRTVLRPPYPCGTTLPPCDRPCVRRPACGHAQLARHPCHDDTQACPPCAILVSRTCLCGRSHFNAVKCSSRATIQCGSACGKQLRCGLHTCKKVCHAPGQCEDAERDDGCCDQVCMRPRSICGHPCRAKCHGTSSVCSESDPCTAPVGISCACGRRKQTVPCRAGGPADEEVSERKRELPCDDECSRQQRLVALREALNIPDDHTDDHVPYAAETLAFYTASTESRAWATKQELEIRQFAARNDMIQTGGRAAVRFAPMPADKRLFLHRLVADYGLESHSEDRDPHRHVVVTKPAGFVAAPFKTLEQAAKTQARVREREQLQRREAAAAAAAAAAEAAAVPEESGGDAATSTDPDWLPFSALRRRRRTAQQQAPERPPLNSLFIPTADADADTGNDSSGATPRLVEELGGIVRSWHEQEYERMAADVIQFIAVTPETAETTETADGAGDDAGGKNWPRCHGYLMRLNLPPAKLDKAEPLLRFLQSYMQQLALTGSAPEHFLCHADGDYKITYREGDGADTEQTGATTATPATTTSLPARPIQRTLTPAMSATAAAAERQRRMAILAQQPTEEDDDDKEEKKEEKEEDASED